MVEHVVDLVVVKLTYTMFTCKKLEKQQTVLLDKWNQLSKYVLSVCPAGNGYVICEVS